MHSLHAERHHRGAAHRTTHHQLLRVARHLLYLWFCGVCVACRVAAARQGPYARAAAAPRSGC